MGEEDYACCGWYLLESEVLLMMGLLLKALVDAKKMFVSLQTNAQWRRSKNGRFTAQAICEAEGLHLTVVC